jgi:hypothetical protein
LGISELDDLSTFDPIDAMKTGNAALGEKVFALQQGAYTLIQWALRGKTEGDGYGFPFDRPHLAFAQRLQRLNADIFIKTKKHPKMLLT